MEKICDPVQYEFDVFVTALSKLGYSFRVRSAKLPSRPNALVLEQSVVGQWSVAAIFDNLAMINVYLQGFHSAVLFSSAQK